MINKFKYCPNCKANIKAYNRPALAAGRLIDCASCGFYFYLSPSPTNGLILENEKGEVLLVKRKYPPKKGYWDIPGGFVDFGETMEESLRREIKEELGTDITDIKYFTSTADRYLFKGIDYHTLCFVFLGKVVGKKNLSANDDINEIKFFSKNNIPVDKLAFSGLKEVFKKYLSSFQQSNRPPKTK
ncbi:hypothetical protein A3A46_00625 [Candidatus Roizmanbacteria bacterium RIFCSPLOWO2_01_FULL_37_13]|uniref:Nudix hydrolase domain-containing protein n=1 Tax=Candidatus Roizmanbacteria bacterium RIFCSPHIGHO2_02_FULL_38_11 TaxID=1802039 RepID=A0A1F7H288_9BACT|nr:MAG: hypothetical protein A3C25_01185 [Candidatus Roizmanbacteria bacterium RIFCSPHIGHO2_02_FULL_38_11]OGK43242.1 MAG: hypothetical protein A3A46_00625 [Candidatus Roizmanbacteria bacterium RIFCSPLOWO2_01_FULL_37_13]